MSSSALRAIHLLRLLHPGLLTMVVAMRDPKAVPVLQAQGDTLNVYSAESRRMRGLLLTTLLQALAHVKVSNKE